MVETVDFSRATKKPRFCRLFFLFAITCTGVAGTAIASRGLNAPEALQGVNCELVDRGTKSRRAVGHRPKHVGRDGRPFSPSDYEGPLNTHDASSHGEPVGEALKIRICSQSGAILRLEI